MKTGTPRKEGKSCRAASKGEGTLLYILKGKGDSVKRSLAGKAQVSFQVTAQERPQKIIWLLLLLLSLLLLLMMASNEGVNERYDGSCRHM